MSIDIRYLRSVMTKNCNGYKVSVEIPNIKFPGNEFSCTPFLVRAKMDRQADDGLRDFRSHSTEIQKGLKTS